MLIDHIKLPTLTFSGPGFSKSTNPRNNEYIVDITMEQPCEVKNIEVYVDIELVDTIEHNVFYSKWDTLHIEYTLYGELLWW